MTVQRAVASSGRWRCDVRTLCTSSTELVTTSHSIPRPIVLAFMIALALTLLLQPGMAYSDDEDRASSGDWIYLSAVFVGTGVLMIVIIMGSRRGLNPHTHLRERIKRRRRPARGPIKR